MTVLCPSNFAELRTMLERAVNEIKGPVAVRYPRGGEGAYQADSGRENLAVLREGGDITLCAYGTMINNVLDAAELLAQQGISARVVKINAISPLYDRDMREVIGKPGRCWWRRNAPVSAAWGSAWRRSWGGTEFRRSGSSCAISVRYFRHRGR